MSQLPRLSNPWLAAVWPGMGQVAINAGFYLMAKLGAYVLAEFSAEGLFEVEHVDVEGGLIRAGRLPRSRFFVWNDPARKRDLVIFIGEAQPPAGKYAFCRRLIRFAGELGIQRVFTFAAMATQMRPEQDSRVFGAAIDRESLAELRSLDLEVLEEGRIGGLNGVLLAAAAEARLRGACLLGEMPHFLPQLPYPKASLAVLRTFSALTEIDIDLAELAEQAEAVDEKLGELLANVERVAGADETDEPEASPEPDAPALAPDDLRRIEALFDQARQDRSRAYVLKRELDHLGVFKEYEDRFLDLFTKGTGNP